MLVKEFIEDTKEHVLGREQFIADALYWNKERFGREIAEKAARWVADNLGASRENLTLVRSFACFLLAEKQPEPKTLRPEGAGLSSPDSLVRSDAIERWVRPWAEAIRRELFKTTAPPFATLEDAIAWIERESKEYARKTQAHAKRVHKWQQQARQSGEGLSRNGFGIGAEITCWMICYPKDGHVASVPATSPTLHRLACEVKKIAQATGWGEVQTTCYLLVKDEKPVVPRYTLRVRLKTATSPQGVSCSRQVAELTLHSADLSFNELRKLYKALRQEGVAKKKPLTKRARAVWKFVGERRPTMKWRELWEEWNATHQKSERYQDFRGFRQAWERVNAILTVEH